MTVTTDFRAIRENSWIFVTGEGLDRNDHLPLLEHVEIRTSNLQVARRLLCMHAVAATAYGFPREDALEWLKTELLLDELSAPEKSFLNGDRTQLFVAQLQVHSAHALAWSSNLIDSLSVMRELPESLISLFPDLSIGQSSQNFVDRLRLRTADEIIPKLDLAYCLDWALHDAYLKLKNAPQLRWMPTVEWHRRALEWLVAGCDWDDVPMDT
jgi:hypothetical protein